MVCRKLKSVWVLPQFNPFSRHVFDEKVDPSLFFFLNENTNFLQVWQFLAGNKGIWGFITRPLWCWHGLRLRKRRKKDTIYLFFYHRKLGFVFPNFKGENHLKLKYTYTKERKKKKKTPPWFYLQYSEKQKQTWFWGALIIYHYPICLINIWTEC